MRSEQFDRKLYRIQGKTASHFQGLQCILDKYQHENHILNQKVTFLLQENQRLKHFQDNKIACNSHQGEKQTFCSSEKEKVRMSKITGKLQSNSKYFNSNCSTKLANKLEFQQNKSIQQINCQSQQKYPQISEARQILQNRKNKHNQMKKWENLQLVARGKHERIEIEPRSPYLYNKGKKIQFTRQVYLETQTILEQQSSQKLPTFIQASFGNVQNKDCHIQLKDQKQKTNQKFEIKKRSHERIIKAQNELTKFKQVKQWNEQKLPIKLIKTDNNKYQKSYRISLSELKAQNNIEKFEKSKINEKQNIYLFSKKTNQPYIKSDYKITEPKTKLTKAFHLETETEQQSKPLPPNRSYPKRTFLSIMSRTVKQQHTFD